MVLPKLVAYFYCRNIAGRGGAALLSLARFAFMAAHPNRFADSVIAEMRGVMTDAGDCPFWDAIGKHFFAIDFPQADSLSTINKRFIEDLMPRYPIYTSPARGGSKGHGGSASTNTPRTGHAGSRGFEKIDLIDIFDGGPVVRCRRDEISAVRRTQVQLVEQIAAQVTGTASIVASATTGFCAALSDIAHTDNGGVIVSESTAAALELNVGQEIRAMALLSN
ncbi:arginine N-succinyltransferase [Aureliella helgolandensis]|nr:arginine N-succinyltransferase [Aureliella helgolandensis]